MSVRPLTALVALACLLAAPAAARAGEHTVAVTEIAEMKAVYATVESTDILKARARIGGTVGGLALDEGDRVEAGQTVAVVGDPKLMLQMRSLDARIQSLAAERAQAATDLERAESLRAQGVIAQARLDDARTRLKVADRQLAAMRAERQVVEQQSAEGAVLAPGSGRVLSVAVVDGSVVLPGEVIATLAAENYILRLKVPERHARFVKAGAAVEVGPRGLDHRAEGPRRVGEVVKVYPELADGRVVVDVAVDGLGDYFVGERTIVWLPTGTRRAVIVPAAALARRFGNAFVTLADGTEVLVQTGRPRADGVEILSGLAAGDVVRLP
ncbi:efflux RND transporter periplasmic adaptor subunit [Roseospirillum parvum]|uniref:RND family efflux transporter, MFP subunit n=1 Tax=Roseospirillum parvum TaxID=83401 RepID=A0A1G8DJV7_9PROT|nr:efflux RND transporter periplasmic adaptor subunit [Roseospirillum parvum]SDH57973.1 RND family efflux transporter, MFP subunit [Roseospirillum parvum]